MNHQTIRRFLRNKDTKALVDAGLSLAKASTCIAEYHAFNPINTQRWFGHWLANPGTKVSELDHRFAVWMAVCKAIEELPFNNINKP